MTETKVGNCNAEDSAEEEILSRPWVQDLMGDIEEMQRKFTLSWCHTVIELGENDVDVESWTEIFKTHIENAFLEIHDDIVGLRIQTVDQIEESLSKLSKLCKDLQEPMPIWDNSLSFYQEKAMAARLVEEYEARVEERLQELKKLRAQQMELCVALEEGPIIVEDSPLPSAQKMEEFSRHINDLKEEKFRRNELFLKYKSQIKDIIDELQLELSLDFEKELLSPSSTTINLTASYMKQLQNFYDSLSRQLESVKEENQYLRRRIEDYWNVLEFDATERDSFLENHKGNSLETLESLKAELARCKNLIKDNFKVFVEKKRTSLIELWDKCHCDDEQKKSFDFFDFDEYSHDLIELYEKEIEKWQKYYEENREFFELLDKHASLWKNFLDLEHSAEEQNRYKNRGAKLLQEEKERNQLLKKIPMYEEKLLKLSDEYEARKSIKFKTFGSTIQEHLEALHSHHENERRNKVYSKKITPLTPKRSNAPSESNSLVSLKLMPSSSKRKMNGSPAGGDKKLKVLKNSSNTSSIRSPDSRPIIVGVAAKKRRSIELIQTNRRLKKYSQFLTVKTPTNDENINLEQYPDFERNLSSKSQHPSTEVGSNECQERAESTNLE